MEPHRSDFKSYAPVGPVVNGRELIGFFKPTDEGAISAFAQAIRRTVEAQHVGPHGADLDFWWRHLSEVAPGLIVTGSFPSDPDEALTQLQVWLKNGVTHVLDCRVESDDEDFLAEHAPDLVYHRVGVDDDGAPREDSWFFQGLAFASEAAKVEGGTLLVYCQMGVIRSPSMAYRILLDRGIPFDEAFVQIAVSRPIVGMGYALDALVHHARSSDWTEVRTEEASERIAALLEIEPAHLWAAVNLPREGLPTTKDRPG